MGGDGQGGRPSCQTDLPVTRRRSGKVDGRPTVARLFTPRLLRNRLRTLLTQADITALLLVATSSRYM